ncbi:MAG: hypothetical protein Q9183_005569 [Haloplaca sp. 2 TL-2023]
MTARIYQTLFSRQKSLKHVELNCSEMPIDRLIDLGGGRSHLDGFEKVQSLRIMPAHDEPLILPVRQFFRTHIATIRTLSLDLSHMDSSPKALSQQVFNEGPYGSAGALEAMFNQGDSILTTFIKSLTLTGVDLKGNHTKVLPALPRLVELEIYRCGKVDDFLTALMKADGGAPKLTKLCINHCESNARGRTREVVTLLNSFLNSYSDTLKELWLCLRGCDNLPDSGSIANHGNSLETLFVDAGWWKGPSKDEYSLGEWEGLCKRLKSGFLPFVAATIKIPTLRHLGMNNWPWAHLVNENSRKGFGEVDFPPYKQHLAGLASQIFHLYASVLDGSPCIRTFPPVQSRPRHPHLLAITIGLREVLTQNRNWGYKFQQTSFVKTKISALGLDTDDEWTMWPMSREQAIGQIGDDALFRDIDLLAHQRGEFENRPL